MLAEKQSICRDPKIDLKTKQLGDIGYGFGHVRAYDFHSA